MSTKPSFRIGVWAFVSLFALAGPAAAAEPNLINAKVEPRSASGGLDAQLRAIAASGTGAAWIGYSVPGLEGNREICCGSSWNDDGALGGCGECRLEGNGGLNIRSSDSVKRAADLEPGRDLLVFLRVENRAVEKVRAFSADCQINAGGRTVYWLTGVRPAESVAALSSLATGSAGALTQASNEEHLSNGAVMAVALHADPTALGALNRFVDPGQPVKLREQAAFWLASARGREGFEVLRRLARGDRDNAFREKLMFDLSISKEPEAVDTLIQSGRTDSSARVRGQALFWLAQKAGKKAAAAISDAIENDPETEVKKRAVFALSQLPKDQGVPLLIQTARSNSNPAVRKQAMFWLGQSNDPRALTFFEQILTRK